MASSLLRLAAVLGKSPPLAEWDRALKELRDDDRRVFVNMYGSLPLTAEGKDSGSVVAEVSSTTRERLFIRDVGVGTGDAEGLGIRDGDGLVLSVGAGDICARRLRRFPC